MIEYIAPASKGDEYKVWLGLKVMFEDPSHPCYDYNRNYGIEICKKWQNDFNAFLSDIGLCPDSNYILAIKKRSKILDSSSVTWKILGNKMQVFSDNAAVYLLYLFNGCMLGIKNISALIGIRKVTLESRIYVLGWPLIKAFTSSIANTGHTNVIYNGDPYVTSSREYMSWLNMRQRLSDKKDRYGNPISICPRWDMSFMAFLEDMGRIPWKEGYLIRLDADKGYSKDNCVWSKISTNKNAAVHYWYKDKLWSLDELQKIHLKHVKIHALSGIVSKNAKKHKLTHQEAFDIFVVPLIDRKDQSPCSSAG